MVTPRPFKIRALLVRVGRAVRAQRRARRMTQRELARRARVNRKHLSALECGQENCTLVTLAYLANVLGCSIAELIQEKADDVVD